MEYENIFDFSLDMNKNKNKLRTFTDKKVGYSIIVSLSELKTMVQIPVVYH